MAKRTTTTWTRHAPDGAEVPLDWLGLFRHGTTTYSGSDDDRLRAWTRDMRGQTGLGLLAEVERAACAIVGSEGARVPSAPRRTGPALTALLAATAEPPQTCRYFAARALGAAIRAREYLEAGHAENAVYCSLRAMWNLWAANLRRSLERNALGGLRSQVGAKKPRPRVGAEKQHAEFVRLLPKLGDRGAAAHVARNLDSNPETIRSRTRRRKKMGE
jgi:hypothetical protein